MINGTDLNGKRLLSPREVAKILGTSRSTLARWRREGKGPKYLKLGEGMFAAVRYRGSDVRAFIEGSAVERGEGTSE